MKTVIAAAVALMFGASTGSAYEVVSTDSPPMMSCGKSTVAIGFEKDLLEPKLIDVTVQVKQGKTQTVFRISAGRDYVGIRCDTGKNGRRYVVVQAYCGGSGCFDLDNFYVISADSLEILLVPESWNSRNRSNAEAILGHEVAPIEKVYTVSVGEGGKER
jgi:hypothetical protein